MSEQSKCSEYACTTCGKKFSSIKYFENHIKKQTCGLTCDICNVSFKSKSAFYRHKKTCTKKDSDVIMNQNNNIDSSNTNIDAKQNTKVDTLQNIDAKQNNVVLMNPFGLEHEYMNRPEMLNPVKGEVVEMLKQHKYPKAYQIIFEHVHGNKKYPENHNIFLPHRDKDEVYVFKGQRFKLERLEDEMPWLYKFLKTEMDWVVKTCDELDPDERDQLMWDIQANWMTIHEEKDENMKRILRNNKDVVNETMKKYKVKPNHNLIARHMEIDPGKIDTSGFISAP